MQPLIILAGPTAAGKTKLSISLAKAVGGEIISADSMQVYQGMDIGSAKIREEEKEGVPHHLLDVLDPHEEFNVSLFQSLAVEAINDITGRGKIPIVVGGTGFYIRALVYAADFTESGGTIPEIRRRLEEEAKADPGSLYERLKEVDPESALIIHPNNVKRLVRALEFYEETGEKISAHNEEMHEKESPYNFAYFVLTKDRENLYAGIDQRVDQMAREGLLEEVMRLKEEGLTREDHSMQGLGYKEVLDHLDGKCTYGEALEKVKLETRHFAKRQLTWFRREKDAIFFNKDQYGSEEEILRDMLTILRNKEIIK